MKPALKLMAAAGAFLVLLQVGAVLYVGHLLWMNRP